MNARPDVAAQGALRGADAQSPLRVMHFVAYYPPQRVGGVGELVAGLHEGLLRRGHDSQVVTSGSGAGERVHRIARTRLGWLLGSLLWARRAAECDVVHCQSGEAALVLLAMRLLPGRRRARGVVTFHAGHRDVAGAAAPFTLAGRRFSPGWARRASGLCRALVHGLLNRLALGAADGGNAIARATAEAVAPGKGLAVIYNGVAAVEDSRVAAANDHIGTGEPSEGPAEPASPELLFVGGSGAGKRSLALPFVLSEVRKHDPGVRLRIAGFGWETAPELEALCRELGVLHSVECIGSLPREALAPVYRSARLLLLPSAYEGLPFVALESMQQGTPVVACRVGGLHELITSGENGLLVQPDDPKALAARCCELLDDPELAAHMSAASRDTISRRFDLDRCVDEHLDYYRSLVREET